MPILPGRFGGMFEFAVEGRRVQSPQPSWRFSTLERYTASTGVSLVEYEIRQSTLRRPARYQRSSLWIPQFYFADSLFLGYSSVGDSDATAHASRLVRSTSPVVVHAQTPSNAAAPSHRIRIRLDLARVHDLRSRREMPETGHCAMPPPSATLSVTSISAARLRRRRAVRSLAAMQVDLSRPGHLNAQRPCAALVTSKSPNHDPSCCKRRSYPDPNSHHANSLAAPLPHSHSLLGIQRVLTNHE